MEGLDIPVYCPGLRDEIWCARLLRRCSNCQLQKFSSWFDKLTTNSLSGLLFEKIGREQHPQKSQRHRR